MDDMEEVYRQFEAFDFSTVDFQNGLENVFESYLDNQNQDKDERIHEIKTEIPAEAKAQLSMQAKTFYFCKATGNIMNIEDYETWKQTQIESTLVVDNSTDQPEYSSNYNELVELILAGRENEIPGIKQIPDTVLEGQSSESTAQSRKKPWEITREEESTNANEEIKEEVTNNQMSP